MRVIVPAMDEWSPQDAKESLPRTRHDAEIFEPAGENGRIDHFDEPHHCGDARDECSQMMTRESLPRGGMMPEISDPAGENGRIAHFDEPHHCDEARDDCR